MAKEMQLSKDGVNVYPLTKDGQVFMSNGKTLKQTMEIDHRTVLHVDYQDSFDLSLLEVSRRHGLILVGGGYGDDIEARILPSFNEGSNWLFEYGDGWKITGDISGWEAGLDSWEGFVNYINLHSSPLTNKSTVDAVSGRISSILKTINNEEYVNPAKVDINICTDMFDFDKLDDTISRIADQLENDAREINSLKHKDNELSLKVNEFDEDINGSETTTTTTEPIQKTGKYYNMNGVNVGSTFNPSAPNSSTGNVCYKLEVNVGDTFYIYGISKSAYVGMYAITNSNNVVTEILHDTTSNYRATPKKIVIAESGYLYINHGNYDAATDKVEREIVTDVKGISEKVSDLEGAVYGEEAIVYDKTYNVVANGGISLEYSNISLESENDYIITIEDEANVLKSLATCYLKPTDGSSLVSFTIYSNIPYPLHTTKAYSQIGLYLASGNGNIVKNGSFKLQVKDKTNAVDGVEQKIEKIGYNTLSNKTIVLCGDSQVGQAGYFAEYLAKFVGAKVLNCGFGGCRYAWRTSDGTDSYDAFSAIGVADALTSKDFTAMDNALVAIGNDAPPHYAVSIANLKSLNLVDGANCILTLAYGSNDFSGGNSLGTAESQDKATMLGAMQYTIEKLLVAYPKLQVIVVGLPYRVYANTGTTITSDSDTYVKTIDGTAYHRYDYSDAILDNARANHLPCFDMYRRSGRNKYNVFEICGDGTHPTTAYGQQLTAELYAKMLTSF